MRQLMIGLALIIAGALLAVPARVTGQGGTVSQSYVQTFDGSPATPAPYRPPGWDVQIQDRELNTWGGIEAMDAQHGPDCAPPPAVHPLGGDYPSHVFQCHDHVMTAMLAGGYGVIYLTPPALADFSTGETVIRWDMSTFRTSGRDWVDMWVSPVQDHLALPLQNRFTVDLTGAPRRAVHNVMDFNAGLTDGSFTTQVYRDFADTLLPSNPTGYGTVLTPSAVVRSTFEVHLSTTHIKMGMPAYNLWWTDSDISPPLDWTQGVVQFGHHSYSPWKDCTVVPGDDTQCYPNTWHWDNVSLSPAVPIQIMSLSPRRIADGTPNTWAFPMPAAPGTMLQFAANNAVSPTWATQIDLSWDGGATWQTVMPQASSEATNDPFHARSYWVPVPVGATSVQIRGQGGYWGPSWQAKDASLWLTTGTPPPVLTPTASMLPTLVPTSTGVPTLPPVATATPVPTSTVAPSPSATPAPLFTFTPTAVATGTLAPTATGTPTPAAIPTIPPTGCVAYIYRDGHFLRVDLNPQPQQCR